MVEGYRIMLKNKIRPKLSTEFSPEPAIGLDLLDDPYGSIGRYRSPKQNPDGSWTNGVFIFDASKPREM